MCILSGPEIQRRVEEGSLVISPFDPSLIQPASIDLRLSSQFILYSKSFDENDQPSEYWFWDKEKIIIYPKSFLLASTLERVELPADLVGRVEGKSSYARAGLFIHITAGYVDPGFRGNLTLELYHIGPKPLTLKKGDPICQLALFPVQGETKLYGGHYQDSLGVVPSRFLSQGVDDGSPERYLPS